MSFAIILLTSFILKPPVKIFCWLIQGFITQGKKIKSAFNNNRFKYLLPSRMINLICLIDHIKKHETVADNPTIQI